MGDLMALFIVSLLGIYMKRFGWPRPALLIGFVLADQVIFCLSNFHCLRVVCV